MNGIHDMGGMHGMGPVQAETNEPVFHERWEGRVYVLTRAIGAWRKWNIDTGRYLHRTDRSGRLSAHELLREMVRAHWWSYSSRRVWSRGRRSRAARPRPDRQD